MNKTRKSIIWLLATLILMSCFGMSGCSIGKNTLIQDTPAIAESSNKDADLVKATKTSSVLSVHFIDVGQGDSILIQSGDHDMLVDAGENDQGDTVVTYLHSQGIEKLDYVIGTHPHSDHIGGLDDVINNFSIDKVILPPVENTTKTYEDVLDAISSQGLKVTKPVAGDTYKLGYASFQIIAPNGNYGDDLNNWSVGIKLTNGDNSFVMCGDAESQAEADICASGINLSADVLKLGHHGIYLASVKDSHKNGLNHVVKMVSQRYLIAPQLPGMGVQIPSSHSGAKVAGGLLHVHHNVKYIRVKDAHRYIHKGCIIFNQLPVVRIVSGIHDNELQLKIRPALPL